MFFSKPHDAYKGSPSKIHYHRSEYFIGQSFFPYTKKNAELELRLEMPVWQLERLFELEYKLHLQLFRRSGNTWLETSVSDDLTLEQQEAKAKAGLEQKFEIVDPLDYREMD